LTSAIRIEKGKKTVFYFVLNIKYSELYQVYFTFFNANQSLIV